MQQSDLMIGKKQFKRQGHTYVMGILNVTPDSFSDGGSYPELSDRQLFTKNTGLC